MVQRIAQRVFRSRRGGQYLGNSIGNVIHGAEVGSVIVTRIRGDFIIHPKITPLGSGRESPIGQITGSETAILHKVVRGSIAVGGAGRVAGAAVGRKDEAVVRFVGRVHIPTGGKGPVAIGGDRPGITAGCWLPRGGVHHQQSHGLVGSKPAAGDLCGGAGLIIG